MHYLYLFIICILGGCATTGTQQLIFEEDFSEKQLNGENWTFETGNGCPQICGWGNEEIQYYTKTNHRLEDGNLIITAKKEGARFTSTRIKTQGKFSFQYGKIEMRAKLPTGKGTWPAFWLLGENINEKGWPLSGEIDIMEFAGKNPNIIHSTLHTKSNHGQSASTKATSVSQITKGFHTYTAIWNENEINFLIDDELHYTYSPKNKTIENWPFNQPFFIVLNFAVGGHFGGHEVDDSSFPQEYIIDYIKVWQ